MGDVDLYVSLDGRYNHRPRENPYASGQWKRSALLTQWFSTRGHLTMPEDIFGGHNGGWGGVEGTWILPLASGEYRSRHRADPHNKE